MLHLLNTADWITIQHSVTVVQSKQYQAADQSSGEFCGQQVTIMPDGPGVVIAGSGHHCDVSVECETMIKHDAKYLHVLRQRQGQLRQRSLTTWSA